MNRRSHNIVKVAVDPRGDSRVDPQTYVMMKFIVNNRTDAEKLTSIWFFYNDNLSNFPLSLVDASHYYEFMCVRLLTMNISQSASA